MRTPYLLVLTCTLAAIATQNDALGQCVQLEGSYSSASGVGTIGALQGTGWSTSPPIGSAVSMWDCGGLGGSGFPSFLDNTTGDINVTVNKLSSQQPNPNGGCARFSPDVTVVNNVNILTGGTVEIFALDGGGNSCSSYMANTTLDNVIAHELGHALTLANSTCGGSIMGPDYIENAPNSDECNAANNCWYTTGEQQNDDYTEMQNCNATCYPKQCEYTGTAWYCIHGEDSPIIFDLGDDGFALTNSAAGVWFDLNADRRMDRTAWTSANDDDAFLSLDRNTDGRIGDGGELFGNSTRLSTGQKAANGFIALAEFDTAPLGGNDDGQLDANDAAWSTLLLWRDSNHDGVSAPTELTPVQAAGVIAIDLHYIQFKHTDENGNIFRYRSKAVLRGEDGKRRNGKIYDVWFMVEPPPATSTMTTSAVIW